MRSDTSDSQSRSADGMETSDRCGGPSNQPIWPVKRPWMCQTRTQWWSASISAVQTWVQLHSRWSFSFSSSLSCQHWSTGIIHLDNQWDSLQKWTTPAAFWRSFISSLAAKRNALHNNKSLLAARHFYRVCTNMILKDQFQYARYWWCIKCTGEQMNCFFIKNRENNHWAHCVYVLSSSARLYASSISCILNLIF